MHRSEVDVRPGALSTRYGHTVLVSDYPTPALNPFVNDLTGVFFARVRSRFLGPVLRVYHMLWVCSKGRLGNDYWFVVQHLLAMLPQHAWRALHGPHREDIPDGANGLREYRVIEAHDSNRLGPGLGP